MVDPKAPWKPSPSPLRPLYLTPAKTRQQLEEQAKFRLRLMLTNKEVTEEDLNGNLKVGTARLEKVAIHFARNTLKLHKKAMLKLTSAVIPNRIPLAKSSDVPLIKTNPEYEQEEAEAERKDEEKFVILKENIYSSDDAAFIDVEDFDIVELYNYIVTKHVPLSMLPQSHHPLVFGPVDFILSSYNQVIADLVTIKWLVEKKPASRPRRGKLDMESMNWLKRAEGMAPSTEYEGYGVAILDTMLPRHKWDMHCRMSRLSSPVATWPYNANNRQAVEAAARYDAFTKEKNPTPFYLTDAEIAEADSNSAVTQLTFHRAKPSPPRGDNITSEERRLYNKVKALHDYQEAQFDEFLAYKRQAYTKMDLLAKMYRVAVFDTIVEELQTQRNAREVELKAIRQSIPPRPVFNIVEEDSDDEDDGMEIKIQRGDDWTPADAKDYLIQLVIAYFRANKDADMMDIRRPREPSTPSTPGEGDSDTPSTPGEGDSDRSDEERDNEDRWGFLYIFNSVFLEANTERRERDIFKAAKAKENRIAKTNGFIAELLKRAESVGIRLTTRLRAHDPQGTLFGITIDRVA